MSVHTVRGSLLEVSLGAASSPVPRVLAVAFAVALTAAAAQFTVPVPFTAVPFTLTPLVVLLVGAALGSRLGPAAQVAYLAAGIAGLPVFAPSLVLPPGAARLLGPTGGYLLAYPVAAFVTGFLAERGWDRAFLSSVAAMLAGLAVIYSGGLAWMLVYTGSFQTAVNQAIVPFVVADIAKAVMAAMMLPTAWKFLSSDR
ncbi:MAG TPA: biotin transporter BioY [Vicinamibacterales bacterium]|nr:biotin transporter BioY [Vicinamibacterales bacterium]